MIFCLSQQHTGTWSSLSWLNGHQEVQGFIQDRYVYQALNGEKIVHKVESGTYAERFHPDMVYHAHIETERSEEENEIRINRMQMMLLATHATLIPMRDPLASLVTYQKWGERDGLGDGDEEFSPRSHVDGFCAIAGSFKTIRRFAHCRFLCWDLLPDDRGKRLIHLLDVAKDLGLRDSVPSLDWSDGRIDNTAGEYPLKTAYKQMNLGDLSDGISEGGFEYLEGKEAVLRPFLEELGYRDLLWWRG